MADRKKRLTTNAEGEFFVDSTCINCGTCRWMAPDVFGAREDHSRVYAQPASEAHIQASVRAAVACPVGAIGTGRTHDVAAVAQSFPVPVAKNVYHCGFHHRDSYGAASYFIVRAAGNVLVDSPRFAAPLVRRIEALGGIRTLFLTHRDDVADHAKFAEHFGCERILHKADVSHSTRAVEIQPEGEDPRALADDLLMIPVPGHTRGSACLLYRDEFLFTGDHLAWSTGMQRLYAFRDACWFDWSRLAWSMHRLAAYDFEHVLPGHGAPCHFDRQTMRTHLAACLKWLVTA